MDISKKNVISRDVLPTRSPIAHILLLWIALDHWSAPAWAYGVAGTFAALWIISWMVAMYREESVNPLK